jgi:hypothetical protein
VPDCAGLPFADDGAPQASDGRLVVSDLEAGHCYRFRVQATDRAGNRGSALISGVLLVDATPPTRPALSASGAAMMRGETGPVFFRSANAGAATLEFGSQDPESGVRRLVTEALSVTRGWTAGTGREVISGSSGTRRYAWASGAVETATSVRAVNGLGTDGPPRHVRLVPDDQPPAVAFEGLGAALTWVADRPGRIAWRESDAGVGVDPASRSVQRQSRPLVDGACGGTWSPDGPAGAEAGELTFDPSPGTCYRWLVTIADRLGNRATGTSPPSTSRAWWVGTAAAWPSRRRSPTRGVSRLLGRWRPRPTCSSRSCATMSSRRWWWSGTGRRRSSGTASRPSSAERS